ncbi:hypothetical protein EC973_006013 [Apophysomyces ossiformis]|uniref:Uncharacterized protein n=1 Tax=Apophysomyces ossiformis TaxID=679940 RepID=A0A8H7BRJ5_9FUNG|nr:hypothetical protein EC973_006013 [Apophysomyces ossiformis]
MTLGGKILIIKMAKMGGVSIFNALYTVCNEYEEIRLQQFTPTKSLRHLRASFNRMLNSYRLCGDEQPEVFFTDNVRGDRQFLENALPSLRRSLQSDTNEDTENASSTNDSIYPSDDISGYNVQILSEDSSDSDSFSDSSREIYSSSFATIIPSTRYISMTMLASTEQTFSQSSSSNTGTGNPRILKDIFHLMDMIKVTRCHSLAKEFARRFRDSIFVTDPDDRRRVEAYLMTKSTSLDYMLSTRPAWVLRRVRRTVPRAEELYPVVENLFREYGSLECAKTGLPLFDSEVWSQAINVLKAIRRGEVSDPPGIPLYFKMGEDKNGLPLYRCSRGTNSLEGGVHQNIIRNFLSFGAGPHLTGCALADYRLRHNIDVSD